MRRFRRRVFLRQAGLTAAAAGLLAACGQSPAGELARPASGATPAAAAPAGAPASAPVVSGTAAATSELIKIGFIPLTDCASVVMAGELGLYAKHGLNVQVVKEASWANIRDKLLTGENQVSHCLFGMPFSVNTGIGGTEGKELMIGMVINANGQAITLSKDFCGQVGFRDLDKVAPAVEALRARKEPTFAMTFPGGTHDMWLRYWLAAAKVAQNSVKIITIRPRRWWPT